MVVIDSQGWTGRDGAAAAPFGLRDWKRQRVVMRRVFDTLDAASRSCGVYMTALLVITAGLTALEVADRFGAGWGSAAPIWVKVGLYAACFLGMTLTIVNAGYEASMLDRWGVFRHGTPMEHAGASAKRPLGRLGRRLERAVMGASVYPGRNQPVVKLTDSLQRFTLAAASAAGFAPGVIFLPDVLRSADHTVPAFGLMVWMFFAFTWLKQGLEVTSGDMDELLDPDGRFQAA